MFTEIHFITSKKGYKLLVYEHYTYALNCRSKNKTSWACSSRCSKRCNAQIILTKQNELVVLSDEHTHPPPVFYVNEKGEYVRVNERRLSQMNILTEEDIEVSMEVERLEDAGDFKNEDDEKIEALEELEEP